MICRIRGCLTLCGSYYHAAQQREVSISEKEGHLDRRDDSLGNLRPDGEVL